MYEVLVSTRAYTKMILHAAKYPHCAINGILLSEASKCKDSNKLEELVIVDAVPLFHQCLHLSPMAEIALTQIEAFAQAADLAIVGYYAAGENFYDNTIDKLPGIKIAEKIAENFPSALFIMIDNKSLSFDLTKPSLGVAQYYEGKWKYMPNNSHILEQKSALEITSNLLQSGAHKELVDFDNHLDDLSLDWGNNDINSIIEKVDAMFE